MEEQKNNSSQEIDLLQVFLNIWNWLAKQFSTLFLFSKKYFWIWGAFLLLGIAIAIFQKKIAHPIYEMNMRANTGVVDRETIITKVNLLQSAIANQSIGKELNINSSDAAKIITIKASPVDVTEKVAGVITSEKENKNKLSQYIKINVLLSQPSDISKDIEKGLVFYVENDAYIAQEWEIFKVNNLAKQEIIKAEISKLEEMQNASIKRTGSIATLGSQMLIAPEQNYHTEILNLTDQLLELQKDFVLKKPLLVQNSFYTPTPVSVAAKIALYAISFGILGLIVSVFVDQRKKAK